MAKKKNISVKEFKAWLEGVEEMQSKNWIPSNEQWKRIRDKISTLDDRDVHEDGDREDIETSAAPVFHTQPIRGPRPLPVSAVAAPQIQQRAPMVMPALPTNPATGMSIKTPDVDTSSGVYRSPFE